MAKLPKVARITGPGRIFDRSVKKGKIKLGFDPSPETFITEFRLNKDRLTIIIEAVGYDRISLNAAPKAWVLDVQAASVPSERLADLEEIIKDDVEVQVSVLYTGMQGKLPGIGDKNEP